MKRRSGWVLAILVVALASPAWAAPGKKTTAKSSIQARDARIEQLEVKMNDHRNEAVKLGGTRNLRKAKRNIEGDLIGLRVRQDELDEVIAEVEASVDDLKAYKKAFEDRSVFTASDAAGEGVEKAGEQAAKKVLSKGAGRALGLLGLALDAGEYGGKWALKQGDLDALKDSVESSRTTLHDLYELHIALSHQINQRIKDEKRIKEIIEADDAIYPEYARLQQDKKLYGGKATRHAVRTRVLDEAGDAEERAAHEAERKRRSREAARRGIQAVPNTKGTVRSGKAPSVQMPKTPSGGSSPPRGRYP